MAATVEDAVAGQAAEAEDAVAGRVVTADVEATVAVEADGANPHKAFNRRGRKGTRKGRRERLFFASFARLGVLSG